MTVARLRQPSKHALQEPRLVVPFGWQPTLSRDGKLLAYVSGVGSDPPHIWLQQTAGGQAIPVTSGSDPDYVPDFSPDGTHIAFYSERRGGGIYIAPTLPGEPRLLVASPTAANPRFSPTGERVLYWQDQKSVHRICGWRPAGLPCLSIRTSAYMGHPFGLPMERRFSSTATAAVSQTSRPDGGSFPWRTGQPRLAHLPGVEQNHRAGICRARMGSDRGQPRMDRLLDRSTSKLEALAGRNLSAAANR